MKKKDKISTYQKVEKEKIRRLKRWIKGGECPPLKIHLNLTDQCNLKCLFCWQRTNDKLSIKDEVPGKRILEVLNEAKAIGVKEVFLSGGGEPLVKENIEEIMLNIKKLGFWADITTNGTLFTKDFIKKLVDAKWDHINFSLDGDEKIHDYLRSHNGAFRKVVDNINYFNYYKNKTKSDLPEIDIAMVLNRKNYALLPYMFELASSLNCSNIQVNAIKYHFNLDSKSKISVFFDDLFGKSLYLKKTDFQKLQKVIKLINSKSGSKYKLDPNLINSFDNYKEHHIPQILKKNQFKYEYKKYVCFEPFINVVINTDGTIGCCCERVGEYSRMNIKDTSLVEIWNSPYFKNVRKSISSGNLSAHCSNCGLWQIKNTKIIKNLLKMPGHIKEQNEF